MDQLIFLIRQMTKAPDSANGVNGQASAPAGAGEECVQGENEAETAQPVFVLPYRVSDSLLRLITSR